MKTAFKFLVLFGLAFLCAGCVFSWKPSLDNSSVNINDNTSLDAKHETN